MPASCSSSELSSHQMAIRSHPGVQKMPANDISSELSAHQMALPRAFAHSRARLCPHASPFSFSSLVSPLRPLGLVFFGRGDLRCFTCCYAVTDAGPASHRVRLWQGGPASTFCRFRLLVQVFLEFVYWDTVKCARAPGLFGGRGEMAMAVASSVRLALLRGAVGARRTLCQMLPLLFLVQRQSTELPATTVGECRRRHSL